MYYVVLVLKRLIGEGEGDPIIHGPFTIREAAERYQEALKKRHGKSIHYLRVGQALPAPPGGWDSAESA
jgi:hypothetical protein